MQADDLPETAPQGKRSWMTGMLMASLALNLLFAGLIVGVSWKKVRHGDWHGRHGFSFSRSLERAIEERPVGRKGSLQALQQRYRVEVKPRWREVRLARRQVIEALRSDPYDEAAVRAAIENRYRIETEVRARFVSLILEVMRQLSPQERKMFFRDYGSRK